jgi:hypothetical protein
LSINRHRASIGGGTLKRGEDDETSIAYLSGRTDGLYSAVRAVQLPGAFDGNVSNGNTESHSEPMPGLRNGRNEGRE